MLKSFANLFLAFATFTNVVLHVSCTEGYYWRDFNGLIPFDAFVGGQDQNEQPIFIGQTLYGATVLPSKIYVNDKKAYYTWGSELSSEANIKILCTQHPEQLVWVDTTSKEMSLLIDKHLVKGGIEDPYDIYLGRAFHKWQTLVGRVRSGPGTNAYHGLYISDVTEVFLDSFQILTYDPKANGSDQARCSKDVLLIKG